MNDIFSILNNFTKLQDNLFIHINDHERYSALHNISDRFYSKWNQHIRDLNIESIIDQTRKRFLNLYGFKDETDLTSFLSDKSLIFDAGCG
ncbi:MAG: hypothetical protein ABDH21_01640 [bacterium]